ncbi:MAG TPA: cell division protein FtsZ, partial [Streptosporangiaceae bacterium]|nr:cell division protein FtsZ [Streptosporangiaceae bacterium]
AAAAAAAASRQAAASADGGAAVVEGVPPPRPAEAVPGPDGQESPLPTTRASTGWLPESASTRRRSVVFEEDDDLDVPDFLK